MKIENKKYYNETAVMSVDLKDVFSSTEQFIETYLRSVERDYPDSFEKLIEVLMERFLKKEMSIAIPTESDMIARLPELWKRIVNFRLSKMKYPQDKPFSLEDKVELDVRDVLRAGLFLGHILATSLTEFLDQETAINYYQGIIDDLTQKQHDPEKCLENLDQFLETFPDFFNRFQGHNQIEFRANEGEMGMKVLKCKWYEIMKDLNDSEFSYAVCCHGDFESIKNVNPNFVLTRTRTLMQGNAFCDFCWHDTRITDDVKHPSDAFWDSLEKQ